MFVRFVGMQQAVDQLRASADVACNMLQGAHVFGETRPAESTTWAQVIGRDVQLGVRNKNSVNFSRWDSEIQTDAAQLVGVRNFDSVPSVVGKFGKLGGTEPYMENSRLNANVQGIHIDRGFLVVCADYDLGWGKIIIHRRALAQKLGIVDDLDSGLPVHAQLVLKDWN